MDKSKIDTLDSKADEFGAIAKKVNESSKRRKTHSEKVISLIESSLEIGGTLNDKLKSVLEANLLQRNQDNIVMNSCTILNSNMIKQLELVTDLKSSGSISDSSINEILGEIEDLLNAIQEALSYVRDIIENDNNIILMDKLIEVRKKYQLDSINTLKRMAAISLEDAEKAINGSSSNLKRGLELVKKFKTVDKLVKDKKKDDLSKLVEDTNKGWNIAVDVNKSSSSQLEFAEKVKQFTHQFHEDSSAIKEMVADKHSRFEQNLQIVTVLTVTLSIKFKKYYNMKKILEKLEYPEEVRNIINNINIFIDIACNDIEELTTLNYDMTDSSHLNNEIETETVDLTKKEHDCYDSIRVEIDAVTEATSYPIEGSSQNIENGQLMEKVLKEIIQDIK